MDAPTARPRKKTHAAWFWGSRLDLVFFVGSKNRNNLDQQKGEMGTLGYQAMLGYSEMSC